MKMRKRARLLKLRHKFRDRFAEQVEADYERMQSPEYAKLAREAEQALPAKPNFRRFGQTRT